MTSELISGDEYYKSFRYSPSTLPIKARAVLPVNRMVRSDADVDMQEFIMGVLNIQSPKIKGVFMDGIFLDFPYNSSDALLKVEFAAIISAEEAMQIGRLAHKRWEKNAN